MACGRGGLRYELRFRFPSALLLNGGTLMPAYLTDQVSMILQSQSAATYSMSAYLENTTAKSLAFLHE